jgi:hypothetical protein
MLILYDIFGGIIVPFFNNKTKSGGFSSEKLDAKILRKYVQQHIDDIFVEFGEQLSIHLILINIDPRQYFFNIFTHFTIHQ